MQNHSSIYVPGEPVTMCDQFRWLQTASNPGKGSLEMDTHSHQHPRVAPDKIGPDDPRYADLVRRGYNKRFAGKPDYVRLVGRERILNIL
jgi:hypothetical protein